MQRWLLASLAHCSRHQLNKRGPHLWTLEVMAPSKVLCSLNAIREGLMRPYRLHPPVCLPHSRPDRSRTMLVQLQESPPLDLDAPNLIIRVDSSRKVFLAHLVPRPAQPLGCHVVPVCPREHNALAPTAVVQKHGKLWAQVVPPLVLPPRPHAVVRHPHQDSDQEGQLDDHHRRGARTLLERGPNLGKHPPAVLVRPIASPRVVPRRAPRL
mmetsp:Transcript_28799/g.72500  ORF Transcript_28799/g.72500 Transcript_28799/m.72500 type:complete len:211 (-) Transcript_28799:103-735(-)